MRYLRLVVLAVVVWTMWGLPAVADDFSAVVKRIESNYGVRRIHPRLIGFALFFAKPAMWGSGVSGLKVAAFEDETRSFSPSLPELDGIMRSSLPPYWRPFVRIDSRRDGESTVIYCDFRSRQLRMLIACVERHDISVVQMKLKKKAFDRWRDDPAAEAKGAAKK